MSQVKGQPSEIQISAKCDERNRNSSLRILAQSLGSVAGGVRYIQLLFSVSFRILCHSLLHAPPNLVNFYFLCIWKSRVSLFSLYLRFHLQFSYSFPSFALSVCTSFLPLPQRVHLTSDFYTNFISGADFIL
jgi:hypothetical protein